MIVTTTLNTSIDKYYKLAVPIAPGEVTRVEMALENAGGKGLNCARAIHTMGEDVVATGFVGGNNGQTIVDIMDEQKLPHNFARIKNQTRCSINVVDSNGVSTEFLEPGKQVSEEEVAAFESIFEELVQKSDAVTINGSMPKGLEVTYYNKLIDLCHEQNVPCFLDTSGESLIEGLKAKPYFIKPNVDEVAQLLGKKPSSVEEIIESAVELHNLGIDKVAVTLGSEGAILATSKGVFKARPPKIELVNPVGSGDTFTGSFAVCKVRGMSDEDALKYAIACSAANCLSEQTGEYDMDTAEELATQITIEHVK